MTAWQTIDIFTQSQTKTSVPVWVQHQSHSSCKKDFVSIIECQWKAISFDACGYDFVTHKEEKLHLHFFLFSLHSGITGVKTSVSQCTNSYNSQSLCVSLLLSSQGSRGNKQHTVWCPVTFLYKKLCLCLYVYIKKVTLCMCHVFWLLCMQKKDISK